jgi:hypothetical protein
MVHVSLILQEVLQREHHLTEKRCLLDCDLLFDPREQICLVSMS